MARVFKTSFGSKVFDVFNYLLILAVVASCIYPLVYMFSLSVSHPSEVGTNTVRFLPKGFNLNVYRALLTARNTR